MKTVTVRNLFTAVASFCVFVCVFSDAGGGLSLNFYEKTCPEVCNTVENVVGDYISRAPSLAAPLLRMHFHDCFVRGCDGSVLLNSTTSTKAEKDAIPNLSLRGFQVIDAAKAAVEKICPGVVSCADILALVARDGVHMLGGPFWNVPTGRRDGLVSIANEALTKLPPPFGNFSRLTSIFAAIGLDVKDLVVLSGAHTIGISHCSSFTNRLYNFTGKGDMDPSLDKFYAAQLKIKCKPGDSTTIVQMDPGSSKTFDTQYYVNLKKRRGLFQSDAALLTNNEAQAYVNTELQGSSFFSDFARSMEKMGKIGVLTGSAGQIRGRCAFTN
jgi:peroxidase